MLKTAFPQTKESTEKIPSPLHATARSTQKTGEEATSMRKDDGAFGTWESQRDTVDSFHILHYEVFGGRILCALSHGLEKAKFNIFKHHPQSTPKQYQ